MRESVSTTVELTRQVLRHAQSEQVTFLAAGIAFYAFLSIFPILLLALALGSLLGGETFAETIVGQVSDVLTPQTETLLAEALQVETGRGGASIIGLVILLWGSLRVFRGLDIAFSRIYRSNPTPGFLTTVRNALLVFGVITAAVLVLLAIRAYLHLFALPPSVVYLSPFLVFFTLVVVFYPMYYVFPNAPQAPVAVVPGAAFAAVGWTLLGELFGLYAANAGTFALFGLIGAVLLLLVWFYFAAIIVLVGAIINAILAGEYRKSPGPSGPVGR